MLAGSAKEENNKNIHFCSNGQEPIIQHHVVVYDWLNL